MPHARNMTTAVRLLCGPVGLFILYDDTVSLHQGWITFGRFKSVSLLHRETEPLGFWVAVLIYASMGSLMLWFALRRQVRNSVDTEKQRQ
jgi:hypothetical protein